MRSARIVTLYKELVTLMFKRDKGRCLSLFENPQESTADKGMMPVCNRYARKAA